MKRKNNPKVLGRASLRRIVGRLKRKGKKVIFTNGCFDILHYGHVQLLERAKKLGDILVVGLNSDSSVKRIKGASRPIRGQAERSGILAGLAAVDYITLFDEDTPEKVIRALAPDVLAKGGDWDRGSIVGADFVESKGGKVVRLPLVKGYSTTSLIARIKKCCGCG